MEWLLFEKISILFVIVKFNDLQNVWSRTNWPTKSNSIFILFNKSYIVKEKPFVKLCPLFTKIIKKLTNKT